MLRAVVLLFAAVALLVGAYLLTTHAVGAGLYVFGFGAVLIASIVFERRYRNNEPRPDERWQSTDEKFVDPTTGKEMDVLYDPASGQRRYVER